ncbi:MAG TPA: DUF2652 domain-containing protein [Anaerolineaceae bacterium]|nr:DUF2652 domain-containing protein [Anaerolineaceae bacterium]
MDAKTQQGFLVLADISGFSSYLAQVELDHANEILIELLNRIIAHFKGILTVCKLEGDAVFATAGAGSLRRGETLLELIDATYAGFRDQVTTAQRNTTCQCRACRAIPGLDLKFFVHFGEFIEQRISGISELVGSDVNLVHRLLKNGVSKATGWQGYALLTQAALDRLDVRPEDLFARVETYEHLGDVQTYSYNLRARYAKAVQARREVVTPTDADVITTIDLPHPPPVVWEWLNDPVKRSLYAFDPHTVFRPVILPGGRTGSGAQTHCVHGERLAMVETILDWRPFEYFTAHQAAGPLDMRVTYRLTPTPTGGTRLEILEQGSAISVRFIDRAFFRFFATRVMPTRKLYAAMAARMAEETVGRNGEQ